MGEHQEMRLRVIVVSTQAALGSLLTDAHAGLVRARAGELLGALEADVLNDGADPLLLARIAEARSELAG